MAHCSRRDVLRFCASLLARPGFPDAVAQPALIGSLTLELAQVFSRSSVKAISPDGTKLCLEDWSERGYPLRVVEIGSWRTLYTGRFSSRVRGTPSFFASSESLLVSAFASAAGGTCGVGEGHCADRHQVERELVCHRFPRRDSSGRGGRRIADDGSATMTGARAGRIVSCFHRQETASRWL